MAKKISIEEYNKKMASQKTSWILITIIVGLGIIAIGSLVFYRNAEKEKQKYKQCIDNAVKDLNKAHVEYFSMDGGFEGYPPADVEATNKKISEVIVDLNNCTKEK